MGKEYRSPRPSRKRANDVVVVLGGIIQFVVAAGTLKIDLVNQVQAIQQGNHAKDRRIIRPLPSAAASSWISCSDSGRPP